MKIGMISNGSNGDIELFISLALNLVDKGHEVELTIITLNNRDYSFLNNINRLVVHQKHIYSEFKLEYDLIEFWNVTNGDIFKKMHAISTDYLTKYAFKFIEKDVVIGFHYAFELSCIAEKFGIPFISVITNIEIIRTNFEPPFKLSHLTGFEINELWDLYEKNFYAYYKRLINKFRKEHGLLPVKNVLEEIMLSKFLNLIPVSSSIFKANHDLKSFYKLSGFWKSPKNYNEWELPEALKNFVDGSEKPVLITVGSMEEHERDKHKLQNILLEAAYKINRKVIILSNWDDANNIDKNVFKLKGFVSYPKLFSKCQLVVHHGGIGILHHVTEAGCPSVIISYGHDQPYNAKVLYDLGISNGSIHRKDLNAESLVILVNEALMNRKMKLNAENLASLLQQENGVKNAANMIEQYVVPNTFYRNNH